MFGGDGRGVGRGDHRVGVEQARPLLRQKLPGPFHLGPAGVEGVEIEKRRVRVLSDPGPQQYCVRQSWLARVGEVALCAPNRVSVEILGAQKSYDTLSY